MIAQEVNKNNSKCGCGYINYEGAEYCRKCGTQLQHGKDVEDALSQGYMEAN